MLRIGIPVFDRVDLLDVMAPLEVLGVLGGAEVVTIAPTPRASVVKADPSLRFETHYGLDDAAHLDVLIAPGGPGLDAVLPDVRLRRWLAGRAARAEWVGSICAGALWLAAAGLLDGYRATTHWASLPLLMKFKHVEVCDGFPTAVFDRDRFTSGGVSTALDASLELRGMLLGEQSGKDAELLLQFAPEPPFGTGNPALADDKTLGRMTRALAPMIQKRGEIIDRIIGEEAAGRE